MQRMDELMDDRLLHAAISGNFREIPVLVNENPEILLGTTSQGSTCLHISSSFGHQQFSETVLALRSALLSQINSDGETPLIVAVKNSHGPLARDLLEHHVQLNLRDWISKSDINGDTALHHAIRNGHEDLAVQLIYARPELSQRVNNCNESPMYIAVMRDFNDVFERLCATDHPSHAGAYDDNALHAAVRNGNLGIIRTIMQNHPYLAKEKNKSGHTPIQYAVHRDQAPVIGVMLEQDRSLGYLVNWNEEYNPLLISAASRGHIAAAQEILMHCPDAPYCNETGVTILHQAIKEGHENFVKFILGSPQLGKLINMRDDNGYTALHYAVEKCNPTIVRALLAHKKTDVRMYDNEGKPAFWRLSEATDSAKSLNWNEVFMLMNKADSQATNFYLRQIALKDITKKSKQEIKSLTETYTRNTSLVAILIASITFAAAFALPRGYSIDPNTNKKLIKAIKIAFKAFLISDTLAMCSSLAVAFTCILARWEDLKFLHYYRSFTRKLMWCALIATNVAFAAGLFTLVAHHFLKFAISICIVSIFLPPILTYILGQWPLLKLQYRLGFAYKSHLLDMV